MALVGRICFLGWYEEQDVLTLLQDDLGLQYAVCVCLVHEDYIASAHSEESYDERHSIAQQHVGCSVTILLTQGWLFNLDVS